MKILPICFPAFLMLACTAGDGSLLQHSGAAQVLPPAIDYISARAVLEEVNALRATGCKCPGGKNFGPAAPLKWDPQLEAAAQKHADDMYRRRYFSHNSPDGAEFSDRISRAGYDWKTVGENIAKGYPTPRSVVKAWRSSREHCPNLMNPKFDDMGVGKAGPYWVQDLGRRR